MKLYTLFTPEEAQELRKEVEEQCTFDQGTTDTPGIVGTVKRNFEARNTMLAQIIIDKLQANREIAIDWLPYKFTTPRFNKYTEGDFYKPHVDAPYMGELRTDIAYTLWLSDPQEYDEGYLIVGDEEWKGNPGTIAIYDCNEIHQVTQITKGSRICVIGWIQSWVKDKEERHLLSRFRWWLDEFKTIPEKGNYLYTTLCKRWFG